MSNTQIIAVQFLIATRELDNDTLYGNNLIKHEKASKNLELLSELERQVEPGKNYQINIGDWECDDSEAKAVSQYDRRFTVVKFYRQILIRKV